MAEKDREILSFWSDFESDFEKWISNSPELINTSATVTTSISAVITMVLIIMVLITMVPTTVIITSTTPTTTSATTKVASTTTTRTSTTTTSTSATGTIMSTTPTTTSATAKVASTTTTRTSTTTTTTSATAKVSSTTTTTTSTTTKTASTTSTPTSLISIDSSKLEQYQSYCFNQKLAFCTNCAPMCTIHTNCLTHDICYDNTPFNQNYWTPLIGVCCGMCNVYCESTETSLSFNIKDHNTVEPPSNANSLEYILAPIFSVILLGLILLGILYYKKQQSKSKCSEIDQRIEMISTISSEDGNPDITNVPLTELWERIKNDDNYKTMNSKSGISHEAPLASVLNSATTRV